ncbi:hypothetical protein BDV96DRAFT_171963 [Lophiotrema nucula]|uniref:Uncharacterized protein n=1 Tax=Lophiotrema nucula TaxID=690887 RepID=A0A6A5Z036_9PLEO|nr:hypothetical protein BDV96DRAFT_171963 [Lophiotrema nucula]
MNEGEDADLYRMEYGPALEVGIIVKEKKDRSFVSSRGVHNDPLHSNAFQAIVTRVGSHAHRAASPPPFNNQLCQHQPDPKERPNLNSASTNSMNGNSQIMAELRIVASNNKSAGHSSQPSTAQLQSQSTFATSKHESRQPDTASPSTSSEHGTASNSSAAKIPPIVGWLKAWRQFKAVDTGSLRSIPSRVLKAYNQRKLDGSAGPKMVSSEDSPRH